jgi:hypothetical protein
MQLEKKVLENMLENSLPIANCQLPIPNSYPDASNISLDGSGSYVFFYIEECKRWVWSKINMGLL